MMFNKRMVYFMGNEKGPEQQQLGPDAAKAKMDEFMPKVDELKDKVETEQKNNSLDEEMKRTDDHARADLIALNKDGGKKFTASVPGIDNETMKQIKAGLDKVPKDHFAVTRMNVDIDGKTFYFAAVYDETKKAVSYYYKAENDFLVNSRDFLSSIQDPIYQKLTGKAKS